MIEAMIRGLLVVQYRVDSFYLQDRLLDRGLSRKTSASICKCYEFLVFVWMNRIIKGFIGLLCLLSNEYGTHKGESCGGAGQMSSPDSSLRLEGD